MLKNELLMLNSSIINILSNDHFKRRFGVRYTSFKEMVKNLQPQWRPKPKRGAKPKCNLEEWLLITLEYWREYRTYFHIGSSWGVSEATVCRYVHWVEDALIKVKKFHLPGKKALLEGTVSAVIMDVTEIPIERPKHCQRRFYSGKKRRHTLKCQLITDMVSKGIICTFFGKGCQHDFKLFQVSGIYFHPETKSLVDKGYQGIQKLHSHSELPQKKPRGKPLTPEAKVHNRLLAKKRISIEHINGRLKVFRILTGRYRNRRRRFGLRCNLIAALYNLEYAQLA